MKHLPLAFALIMLLGFVGNLRSAPIYVPEAVVMDRLAAVYATRDPARIAAAYRAMGDFGLPAAEIVESSINAMGYRHLENNEVEAAISVFRLNIDTFPISGNAWDSLGEALLVKGDHELAIRCYERSLERDPENSNAARMIEKLTAEAQPSQVSHLKN